MGKSLKGAREVAEKLVRKLQWKFQREILVAWARAVGIEVTRSRLTQEIEAAQTSC